MQSNQPASSSAADTCILNKIYKVYGSVNSPKYAEVRRSTPKYAEVRRSTPKYAEVQGVAPKYGAVRDRTELHTTVTTTYGGSHYPSPPNHYALLFNLDFVWFCFAAAGCNGVDAKPLI